MNVHLDHASTTPCDPRVVEAMLPWFTAHFENAASRSHGGGMRARRAVEAARGAVALRFGCSPKELVFTSGATEANNLALLGVLRANRDRGDHLVVSAIEHKSVLDVATAAAREGFRTTVVGVGPDGLVDPQAFVEALEPRTVLASLMTVNNEVGTIQPIEQVGLACRERGVLFHTDAVQAAAWMPLVLRDLPVDLVSLTAHKMNGPKGVGVLYVRRGRPSIAIEPLIHGGGHERGLRSGTLPVPLLVGFGKACEVLDLAGVPAIAARRDRLWTALQALEGIALNGHPTQRVAGTLNVRLDGIDVKAVMLAAESVAMASGSACTSESLSPSHVLLAMGLEAQARQSLRFSLGHTTTDAAIEHAIQALTTAIREVRALTATPER